MNTSIKSFFNNTKVQLIMFIGMVVIGFAMINSMRSKINYLDQLCPRCDSYEVLDFGYDERMGGQHGHCPDCGCDFYVHSDDCDVTFTEDF